MPEICLHTSLLSMKHKAFSCIIAMMVMEFSGNMSIRSIYWHLCTCFFLRNMSHKIITGRLCLHFLIFLSELISNKCMLLVCTNNYRPIFFFFTNCFKWTYNVKTDSEIRVFLSVNIEGIFQSDLKWTKELNLESDLVLEKISYAQAGVFWIVIPCSFGDGHQTRGR
jgi:hypothetical protein